MVETIVSKQRTKKYKIIGYDFFVDYQYNSFLQACFQ